MAGRPSLDVGEQLKCKVPVGLTESENEILDILAKKRMLSKSYLLRELLRKFIADNHETI